MSYITKITTPDGTSLPVAPCLYGTCTTAASTAAKVVTCTDFDTAAADIPIGTTIRVKFTNTNRASNSTLNINNTGAIAIKKGTDAPGITPSTSWDSDFIVSFTYDGLYWQMNDHSDVSWRPVAVNDTTKLQAAYANQLNIKDGTNIAVTYDSGVIISTTDNITAPGNIQAGSGASEENARWCRAENGNGWVSVMTNSINDAAPVFGVQSKSSKTGATAHYMLFRDMNETTATVYTSGTYIGGYNYNNEWESFLVQGRSAHYWGVIPAIQSSNGVVELGKHIDFHIANNSTTDYNYRISCTADGAATYSGTWSKASSIKVKENIEDITLAEAQGIFELRPVKFDYK